MIDGLRGVSITSKRLRVPLSEESLEPAVPADARVIVRGPKGHYLARTI